MAEAENGSVPNMLTLDSENARSEFAQVLKSKREGPEAHVVRKVVLVWTTLADLDLYGKDSYRVVAAARRLVEAALPVASLAGMAPIQARRGMLRTEKKTVFGKQPITRAELMSSYKEDWGHGEGHGEGWVAYGSALVRDGALVDLRAGICRVLGVSVQPGLGAEAWTDRVEELRRNSGPWSGDRAWMDWFGAIQRGLCRWVLLGGAEAERRETIRDGKAKEKAALSVRRRWCGGISGMSRKSELRSLLLR